MFVNATLYIGEMENRYLTKEVRRKVYGGWSDDLDFVFAHTDTVCRASQKQKPHDLNAPMTRTMTRKNRPGRSG